MNLYINPIQKAANFQCLISQWQRERRITEQKKKKKNMEDYQIQTRQLLATTGAALADMRVGLGFQRNWNQSMRLAVNNENGRHTCLEISYPCVRSAQYLCLSSFDTCVTLSFNRIADVCSEENKIVFYIYMWRKMMKIQFAEESKPLSEKMLNNQPTQQSTLAFHGFIKAKQ